MENNFNAVTIANYKAKIETVNNAIRKAENDSLVCETKIQSLDDQRKELEKTCQQDFGCTPEKLPDLIQDLSKDLEKEMKEMDDVFAKFNAASTVSQQNTNPQDENAANFANNFGNSNSAF